MTDAHETSRLTSQPAESEEGYKQAWQEIADLLDIPAQVLSPREVHEQQVMPSLREALSYHHGRPRKLESIWIQWSDCGNHIRRWRRTPFDGGEEITALVMPTAPQPDRESRLPRKAMSIASARKDQAIIMLDGDPVGSANYETAVQIRDLWNAPATPDNVLRKALRQFIYETTCLSPMNDDGSHDCRVSAECLENGRKAYHGTHPTTDTQSDAVREAVLAERERGRGQ